MWSKAELLTELVPKPWGKTANIVKQRVYPIGYQPMFPYEAKTRARMICCNSFRVGMA